jgi:hypothetical protein
MNQQAPPLPPSSGGVFAVKIVIRACTLVQAAIRRSNLQKNAAVSGLVLQQPEATSSGMRAGLLPCRFMLISKRIWNTIWHFSKVFVNKFHGYYFAFVAPRINARGSMWPCANCVRQSKCCWPVAAHEDFQLWNF